MLTRSSTFETYAATSGHQRDVVLAITQNSVIYYFSTRPMPRGLNSEPVYPILVEHGVLTEGIDIFTKQSQVSDVKFVLSDDPYYPQTGSVPIRASKLLEDLNGEVCKLYQWTDGITDVADCLLVFSGYILQSLEVNRHTVKFTAKDRSKLWDKMIPERIIGDEWTDAPVENLLQSIPIVYGDFSIADIYNDEPDATGLVPAAAYRGKLNSWYVVADHYTHTVGQPYRNTGGPTVLPVSPVQQGNRGGPSVIRPSQYVTFDFFVAAVLPNVYNDEAYFENESNRNNLADNNIDTVCDFTDRLSDDGDYAQGLALWGIQYESILRQHLVNGGYIKAGYRWISRVVDERSPQGVRFYLYFGVNGVDDERVLCGYATRLGEEDTDVFVWDWFLWQYPGNEEYRVSSNDVLTETPGDEWAFGINWYAGYDSNPFWDGVVNNQNIAEMGDAKLRYHFTTPFQPSVWCAIKGKDMDPVRRHMHLLEDVSLVIEDMYRTHFSLTDDDIDVNSFEAAENTNVKVRISISEKVKFSDVVQQLSEQSTVIIVASGAGKIRCIPLNDKAPAVVDTVRRGQLANDDFHMTKTRFIINNMTVNSQWQAEYQRFLESNVYTDAVSQSEVRVRTGSFDWPNIMTTSAAHIAEHYVNATDGIWSKEHIQVRFTTSGFTHSYLQPGDWISFNDDVDALKPAFSTSWEDKKLLIIKTEKDMDSVTITAVELYETVVSASPEASPSPSPSPSPEASPSPEPSYSPSASPPGGTAPWGRYDQLVGATPIALPWLHAMTDGNVHIEVGSDSGYISMSDHYCLEFEDAERLDTLASFVARLDRSVTGFPALIQGAVEIYYSKDNYTWTKWGTTRTHLNGGLMASGEYLSVHGDGPSGLTAMYWKFYVVDIPADVSGSVGLTELTATIV